MLVDNGYSKTPACSATFRLFSLLVLETTEEPSLPLDPRPLQVCFSALPLLLFFFFSSSSSSSVILSRSGNFPVPPLLLGWFFWGYRFFCIGRSTDRPSLLALGEIVAPSPSSLSLSLSLSVPCSLWGRCAVLSVSGGEGLGEGLC